MASIDMGIFSEEKKQVYQEMLSGLPGYFPDAVDIAMQFMGLASQLNIKKEAIFWKYGITSGRFALLMLLRAEESRSLSPSELAKRADVSRGTMTQFIDALEKDGFAKRCLDPRDRRAMQVALTEKGDALLDQLLPIFLKHLCVFAKTLNTEEQEHLSRLLRKIGEGVSCETLL